MKKFANARLVAGMFALGVMTVSAFTEVKYSVGATNPDPASQGWIDSEVTINEGGDADGDGFIDTDHNAGLLSDEKGLSWQIWDHLTSESQNLPLYRRELSNAEVATMFHRGWELEFEVRVKSFDAPYAGFCGWGYSGANDPGWGVSTGTVRVGFNVGLDEDENVWLRQEGEDEIVLGPKSEFYSVRAVGEPRSPSFELFVDGVKVGDYGMKSVPNAAQRVLFLAGTTNSAASATDWKRVSLRNGFGVQYNSSAGGGNPVAQGWTTSETFLGSDSDNDGFIDGGANVGPVFDSGEVTWQIFDQLTGGTQNYPTYRRALERGDYEQFYQEGWEYEFTVRAKAMSPRWSGFTGWGVTDDENPGWNFAGAAARIGFFVGFDEGGDFWVRPDQEVKVNFGAGTAADFHTIRAVGLPESTDYEWFVDGVSQGTIAMKEIGGAYQGLVFEQGSSADSGGATDWKSVSLQALVSREILMDSDTGVLSVEGVDQEGIFMAGTERESAYTSVAYNGLRRFVFTGDFVLLEGERLRGAGGNAISITVAGDLVVETGAVVDVSATEIEPGPGGGYGGGIAGGIGKGGGRGNGGDTVGQGGAGGAGGDGRGAFGSGTGGTGTRGHFSSTSNALISQGASGKRGSDGMDGTAGYGQNSSGGIAGAGTDGGAGGEAGVSATGGGAGGAGGNPNGADDGSGGSSASKRWVSEFGYFREDGKTGGRGEDGMGATNGASHFSLAAGGGGASGGGGGGGGGGGAGGGGRGGGGGGGGGAGVHPIIPPLPFGGFDGGRGGNAGKGGKGGHGGVGGKGGRGGHGGGGIEIVAYGIMQIGGLFKSEGSFGLSGEPGSSPTNTGRIEKTNGSQGVDGQTDAFTSPGGDGGKGGNGSVGGSGQAGGAGGSGGGGSGGMVKFYGSVLIGQESEAHLAGGPGGSSNNGSNGRLLVGTNSGEYLGTVSGGTLEDGDEGLRERNEHLADLADTPLIPHLVNGADVAGLLDNSNAWTLNAIDGATPANARVAVMRFETGPAGYDHDFEGYDSLVYVNLTGEPLTIPFLGAGSYAAQLIDGGLATNPVFGGNGAGLRDSIPPYGAYATLVPEVVSEVTFGFTPSTYARTQTSVLPDGGVAYLSFGEPVVRVVEEATDYPEPELSLPEVGPFLEFAGTGVITTTIQPEAVRAAATWSVQGQPGIYQSGATAVEIPLEGQTVVFQPVRGWIPPRSQAVEPLPDTNVLVDGSYREAPRLQLLIAVEGAGMTTREKGIAPRTVKSGDTSGFYIVDGNGDIDTSVTMSAPIVPAGGVQPMGLISLEDGWFIYQPSPGDRQPFEIEFTGTGMTEPVSVEFNPVPDLKPEETILQTRIGAGIELPDGSDSEFSTRLETDPIAQPDDEHGNPTPDKTRVVYTGREIIVSESAPNSIFGDLEFSDPLNAHYAVHLYAGRVEVGSTVDLYGADLIVFARELDFVGGGAFVNAGEVTLNISSLSSPPGTTERFTGYSSLISPIKADELGPVVEPNGNPIMQMVAGTGELPVGLRWMHPLALRQTMIYIEKLYYLGFYDETRSLLADYLSLLQALESHGYVEDPNTGDFISTGAVVNLPDAEDEDIPLEGVNPADDGVEDFALFAFSQIGGELETLSGRLSDNLDYFGNPLGWTPMLSFEVTLASLEQEIDRSMRALYLSYWVGRKAEQLAADAEALQQAREDLNQENTDLRTEMTTIRDEELPAVQAQADSLDNQMDQLQSDLALAEQNLEQRAEELVDQRNNVPVWKKVVRGVGSIASVVPVFQPALAAVGGGLEIVTRVDEQDPLDTVLDVVNLGAEFGAARYDLKAQDIEDSIAEETLSDDELQAMEFRGKASKVRSAGSGLASGAQAFQDYLKSNEAAAGEVGRELERLRASDPQLAGLAARLQQANLDKIRFANQAAQLESRMAEIPAITQQNLLGMRSLKQAQRNNGNVLNPQALGYVKGMEARAKMRLRKALYLLAKSYEYRFLEPYSDAVGQPIDLVDLSDRLVAIGEAAGIANGDPFAPLPSQELNPDQFDSLRGIYDSQLADLTSVILERPQNELVDEEPVVLTVAQLDEFNREGSLSLNLVEENFLRKDYEQFRIVSIEIDELDYSYTGPDPAASDGEVSLQVLHGTSDSRNQTEMVRMQKNGETYLFNPLREANGFRRWASDASFNDASDIPDGRYRLENSDFDLNEPSAATNSLIASLSDSSVDLLQFSRPAAQANLWLNRVLDLPEGTEIVFERVALKVRYDYFVKDLTRAEIEVAPLDGSLVDRFGSLEDHQAPPISPRIWVDRTDLNRRDDGYGRFVRSYRDSSNGPAWDISLTAEHEFGLWQFVEWRRISSATGNWQTYTATGWQPSLNLDPDPQVCADSANHPCTVVVANTDHERVYPIYVYTGDTEPAEVDSIVRDDAASQGGVSEFVITFSEGVIGVDAEDFAAAAGESPLSILEVSGTGSERRVRVAGRATSLKLNDNDTILDEGGNFLSGEGKENGNAEVIVEVSDPLQLELSGFAASGAPMLRVTGEEGAEVQLQWSQSLANESWSNLETLILTGGEATTSDAGAIGQDKRFYRVRE